MSSSAKSITTAKPDKDSRGKAAAKDSDALKEATRTKYGKNATPDVERKIMHPSKQMFDGGRKNWANHLDELEGKMRKTFFDNAKRIVGKEVMEKLGRSWVRAVPFVGWAMTAYDVVDMGITAVDLWKQYKATGVQPLKDLAAKGYNIFEARPDLVISNEGGVDDIYDFKFGKQGWEPGQEELYNDILKDKGKKAKSVDQNSCQCKQTSAGS